MRAVSEPLVILILFMTVVLISLSIFFFSTFSVDATTASVEYGYVKSMFREVAFSIPEVLNGQSIYVRHPSSIINLGYRKLPVNLTIQLEFANGSRLLVLEKTEFYAITGGIHRNVLENVGVNLIFGRDKPFVTEIRELALVREYYSNGWTFIELDTSRIYCSIYRVGFNNYYMEILVVDFGGFYDANQPPSVIGGGSITLKYDVASTLVKEHSKVANIYITHNQTTLTLREILPPNESFDRVSGNLTVRIIYKKIKVLIS
ncbi:MAG: hypothetical protein QXV51_02475 [Thermosphaera sp.]